MATIIISTTQDDDYLFYLPIVVKKWEELGHDVFLFYVGDPTDRRFMTALKYINSQTFDFRIIKPIQGIRDCTLAQCSRLLGCYFKKAGVTLITSDIDMIVHKDIFSKEIGIHIYGHDLTNYEHVPMCYIQMSAARWAEVMGVDSAEKFEQALARIINEEPLSKSQEKFGGWWCVDQEIITKKLSTVFHYKHDRGQHNSLPVGRLDRSGWKMPEEIIDIHLPKEPLKNLDKIIPVTYEWVKQYANEYVGS